MEQPVRLVGIARLAAQGSKLEGKRRVEYRTLPTRNWLNRCSSRRVPFDWTINPYRGCEYGCKYCYARFTHEFLEKQEADAFETEIFAKEWNPAQFQSELAQVKPGQVVALGTATDPYQPAERRLGRTRAVVEALTRISGICFYVTTKSDLVARDADVFARIAEQNEVGITVTVTTMDANLAKRTEPYAPRPALRIKAVRELVRAGLRTGGIGSPVLPWITDSEENLGTVAQAAKEAGADYFGANVLFLQPCSSRVYFPFIEEQFPALVERYRQAYRAGAFLKGAYPEQIRERVNAIRERVGLTRRDLDRVKPPQPRGAQMMLF
jgi:DNA repair photolyase